MAARADTAFAQVRLQARHAALPDAQAWHVVEASRTSAHYLALARKGPLARWIDGLDDAADVHRVEEGLRSRWRRYVDEVSRWQPAPWRDATRWFGVLVELPLVAGLLRGDPRARGAWPALPPNADADARADALRSAGLAPFAVAVQAVGAQAMAAIWHAEWRRRLPPGADSDRALHLPAEWLVPRLRDAAGERAAAGEPLRRALVRLFRRHAFSPVAAYAHLALVALDVERLRGGVAARSPIDPVPPRGGA